jgi:hypothetical protein
VLLRMRLLKIDDHGKFCVESFLRDKIPPYIILSHTWSTGRNDEVTLKDIIEGTGSDKPGYRKLKFCADRAKADGLYYFWVDSACIDKSDSVQLQTAINSMFRWYQNAMKCYVYLSDVLVYEQDGKTARDWKLDFRNSRWFTRGWTLQELLAPKNVAFYSYDLERLGDKKSLEQQIIEITALPARALREYSRSDFSVEERFLWVNKRQTTEEEDIAYCMLGLFDIFLPLIYGEGQESAIRRLNKEIHESASTTQSIGNEYTNVHFCGVAKMYAIRY